MMNDQDKEKGVGTDQDAKKDEKATQSKDQGGTADKPAESSSSQQPAFKAPKGRPTIVYWEEN